MRLRCRLYAALAVLACAAAPASAQLADGHDKFLGAIGKGTDEASPDPDFDVYFDQLTVENAGKWKYPERARDQMNWAALDYWYSYAQDRGFPLRQHTFVWDIQRPDWIDGLPPAEQRAEVEEWIRLFFQRYPDVAFVDVVNEPVAQPASYRAALGGAGATGWDWVIWTFETAARYRDQYAPDARLFLNEFNILKSAGKRATYLEIVGLLQDRGLIDGVGVQGHWLEGTSAAAVRSALDEVAATGLPIHVTELDLSFASDQAQLEKYQELFPVLWEHPAVEGVTLWGYEEGRIWRGNAFLVRADGTERPALGWLRDYLADGGGPPDGRDAYAAIEAEGHDAQRGLQTWSTAFGYFDAGDWARYDAVDFGAGASAVTVRLALPASFAGKRIELRLGSPSGALVGTLVTEGTGGWNTYGEQRASVGGASGVQDLYLVGAGGTAIANVDRFRFERAGAPVAVRARGRTGTERMELRLGGETVASWTVGTAYAVYTHAAAGPVAAVDVSVAFVNDDGVGDGTGRDLRVDRVTVGGVAYESEAATTYSTGTWSSGSGCGAGFKQSEWLHCPGAFFYGGEPGVAAASAAAAAAEAGGPALGVYPNPTSGAATVAFALDGAADVRADVYDALGRHVAVVADDRFGPGPHEVAVDAARLPPGLYLVRLSHGGSAWTHPLTVAR